MSTLRAKGVMHNPTSAVRLPYAPVALPGLTSSRSSYLYALNCVVHG